MKSSISLVFLLTLMIFQSAPAKALVYVNHGPAFYSDKKFHGGFTQEAILALYAEWNLQNTISNKAIALKLKTSTLLHPELKSTQLHPSRLDNDNLLAFGYRDEAHHYQDWSFISTSYGYCHGMTLVNRAFIYLAKFEPKKKAPYDYKKDPKQWLSYYEGLVDSVMNGQATVIPGFEGLSQFSTSPIAEYLQRHVADQWGINTAKLSLFTHAYGKNFHKLKSKEDVKRFRDQITAYLKLGFYPRVVLGKPRYLEKDAHVVMVKSMLPESNSNCISFKYWDVGQSDGAYTNRAEYCIGDSMYLPSDDVLYYLDLVQATQQKTK